MDKRPSQPPCRSNMVVPVVLRNPSRYVVDSSDPRFDLRMGTRHPRTTPTSRRMGWLDYLRPLHRRWKQSIDRKIQMIPDAIQERITNGVAVGGLGTYIWFEYLREISEVAAAVLPVISVVWIAVQLINYFMGDK